MKITDVPYINESAINEGLTKREYFAIITLQTLLSSKLYDLNGAVKRAILISDTLIEGLNPNKSEEHDDGMEVRD